MSLIKICGLSREIDIEYANMLKPDFIGFIFAKSSRMITKSHAATLKKNLDPAIKSVGVFVNADQTEILDMCQRGIIDLIQLHGDEDGDYIKALKAKVSNPIIKSVSIGPGVRSSVPAARGIRTESIDMMEPAVQRGGQATDSLRLPGYQTADSLRLHGSQAADYLILDTYDSKLRGGSGVSFDWSLIGRVEKPFFLAGGLNIGNIGNAIRIAGPYAVDVSSGVETDGFKDFTKMSRIIDRVRGGNAHD